MFEALGEALTAMASLQHMLFLIAGVLMGLSIGVFPGLGGIAGLSLLLPFMYGLDPVSGLALMVGLVAVIPTSDTFTSVLMGIPGSSASQATVLDGFPLSKKGQAARALGAAFTASLFGGLFGAIILTFFVLIARPLILTFRTPELLMLTILGFSMVGVLAGRSLTKGIVAAGIGLLVGAIGEAPAQGSPRMDFGTWYLGDGFQLVIVGLGIFAIPEIVNLLRSDQSIAKTGALGAGWIQGFIDWWRNLWLSLRCAGFGTVIGVIPGLGGAVVDWIAYGHAKQTTKDASEFGKGDIRGVIAPESANNAKEGGGLVPTLLFGIPGSGSMAVFLGGMVLLGLEAGPAMVKNELDTTYTIVWSLAIANVFGAGLCLFLAPYIARLTTIPFPLLAPFMFMMITFAAFQSKQTVWDLVALVGIGLLGIFMKRFDWPRPAFLIGFVLADQAEVYTYQAAQFTAQKGWTYLVSPTVGIIAAITILSVWMGARQNAKMAEPSPNDAASVAATPFINRTPQIVFAGIVAFFIAAVAVDAWNVSVMIDRVFPLSVAIVMFPLALLVIAQLIWSRQENPAVFDGEVVGEEAQYASQRSIWNSLNWLFALLIGSGLVGFIIANTIFFAAFLKYRARASWLKSLVLTACATAAILALAHILNRDFPPGLLQEYMDLPWPFR